PPVGRGAIAVRARAGAGGGGASDSARPRGGSPHRGQGARAARMARGQAGSQARSQEKRQGREEKARGDDMKAIVSVRDAVKDYTLGKVVVPALRGVSLEVVAGDFLSIAGPSGSGKTTLLNLIGCVDTPTSGSVVVAGSDTSQLSERQLTALRLN